MTTCFSSASFFAISRASCSPQMCWIIACQCSYQRGLPHPANLVFARENVNIDNICPLFCAWTSTPCDAIKQFDLRQKSEQLDKEERTQDFCPVSSLLAWMRRTHVIFGKSCRGCQGWPHPFQHPSPQQPNQLLPKSYKKGETQCISLCFKYTAGTVFPYLFT